MRKLLSILGSLSLMVSTTISVVSCGYAGGFFFTGRSLLYDLDTTNLGTFNQDPSYEDLMEKTKYLNPELNDHEVTIVIPESNKDINPQLIKDFEIFLKVKENSRYYNQDVVLMQYGIDYKQKISDVITGNFLGSFKEEITINLIKEQLLNQYSNLKIDQIEISEINYAKLTVTIVAKEDSIDYVANSQKVLSFDYGTLISLRAILKNEKPLEEFHADIFGFNSSVVISEMKASYKDIVWEELEQLDDSKFNENKIIFKVKKDSTIYLQDTVEVSFRIYQRVLVDSVITNHSLQDIVFPRTPEFNQTNLNKMLDEVAKYNRNFHKEGIVFDHVTKADDFNGSGENKITFRATTASIWYVIGSTFTMTYQRDFHGWNHFVPRGDLSNNFVNIMELNREEFMLENAEIQKNYEMMRSANPLKWNQYDLLLRLTKLSNETPERFYAAVKNQVSNFGADDFDNFTRNYLRLITAELKAIEKDSPSAKGKIDLANFYFDKLWGGRTGDGTPNPGRLMAFLNAGGMLNKKTALWLDNINKYVENWLDNWGSPVSPTRF